jgi:hypothetical protein
MPNQTEFDNSANRYVPKESGNGFKVDPTTPTFPWRDITGTIAIKDSAAGTNPSFVAWKGATLQYQFDVGDLSTIVLHMPHDWAVGTPMYIHSHWTHNSASVTTGAVDWEFDISFANGFDTDDFVTTNTVNAIQNASTQQLQHMIAEVQIAASGGGVGLFDSDDMEVDGIFVIQVKLNSNTMDGGAKPFLHEVDIHYQSTNIGTKDKAPPFYG